MGSIPLISRPRFEGKLPAPVAERIGMIRERHGRIAWHHERLLTNPGIHSYKKYARHRDLEHAKIAEHTKALIPKLARAAKGHKSLRKFLKDSKYSYIDKAGRLTGTNMPHGKYLRMDNSVLLGRA